ncbi:hypothetical protein [Acinetobacter sp. P1(2025)]|uniref:hypothetical protein n=1 Tax=Acinetobacter sp. P1(2025) TaxID=3446120 RepID=UPI003F53E13E
MKIETLLNRYKNILTDKSNFGNHWEIYNKLRKITFERGTTIPKEVTVELLNLLSNRIRYYLHENSFKPLSGSNLDDCTDCEIMGLYRIIKHDSDNLPKLYRKVSGKWEPCTDRNNVFSSNCYKDRVNAALNASDVDLFLYVALFDLLYPPKDQTTTTAHNFYNVLSSLSTLISVFRDKIFITLTREPNVSYEISRREIYDFTKTKSDLFSRLTDKRLIDIAKVVKFNLDYSEVLAVDRQYGDRLDALDQWKAKSVNMWEWFCWYPKYINSPDFFDKVHRQSRSLRISNSLFEDASLNLQKESFSSDEALQAWIGMPRALFTASLSEAADRYFLSDWWLTAKDKNINPRVAVRLVGILPPNFFNSYVQSCVQKREDKKVAYIPFFDLLYKVLILVDDPNYKRFGVQPKNYPLADACFELVSYNRFVSKAAVKNLRDRVKILEDSMATVL